MTDVLVRTLRIHGPRAGRLARTAARELPAALERALADLADVDIAQIVVRLDFDPADMDDATVATLWAEAIRVEVLAAGASVASPATRRDHRRDAERTHPSHLGPSVADAVRAAREWLAAPLPRGPAPVAALSLAEPSVADAAIAAIGRPQWAGLVTAIDEALSRRGAPAADAGALPEAARASLRETSDGTAQPFSPADRSSADSLSPINPADAPCGDHESNDLHHDRDRAAVSRVSALADLLDPDQTYLNPDMITQAAGLALLYPWLADICREAVGLYPDRAEADVRALALAGLVDPEDHSLAADPLITFLAGRAEPLELDAPRLAHADALQDAHTDAPPHALQDAHADALQDACERALTSFASLLPGFAGSTPAFVRQQWIARAGIVDASRDPALLTAATHPLDVVLAVLPYPVALFALPWTRPMSVRFRP